MPCVVSLALSACGGSSHHSSSSPSAEVLDWAQTTGDRDTDSIVEIDESAFPQLNEGCEVPQGALIVMGDVFDKYFSWIWNDSGNILGDDGPGWPGAEFTDNVLAACSEKIHWYAAPEGKSMENYFVIVNHGDNTQQTGDAGRRVCRRAGRGGDHAGRHTEHSSGGQP